MKEALLLDRLKEVVLVIKRDSPSEFAEWIIINEFACSSFACTREEFLQHAKSKFDLDLYTQPSCQKAEIQIEGGRLFNSKTFQFDWYEETLNGEACWVLVGEFVEQMIETSSLDKNLLNDAISSSLSDAVVVVANYGR